ncbi:MAG TPA: diacylglycerol kinase [Ruminiclostridium sp.]|nr:diacylglycerol kinase family protein [Clostridiaceae bacterium]HAA24825.1 diacylglycerol kinase [Ruminiclostridium sp.]
MKSRTLFDSFKYAAQGMKTAFTQERNFRIHCITAVIVVILGIFFRISFVKWALVFVAFGFVFVSELVNTAAETLVDMITKEYSINAKRVKDLAAAAVLVSAAAAAFIGVFVFIEPVLKLLGL